ncbi:MAG TPA: isomerizing glutamine--fructose-6-phosphate transaminase [Terriglobales bacterium]
MTRNPSKAKNGFPHFMLKEIYEQPDAVRRVIAGRIDAQSRIVLPGLGFSQEEIRDISKITVAASGSSRHAGIVGEFMLERMTGLPVEVDFASQYCYRDPVVVPHELTIFLSQSGTTIDTITALNVARRKGGRSLAICNVPDTPLIQNADTALLTYAGEEVAIAATKSFTTQLTALFLLAAFIGQTRGRTEIQKAVAALTVLPESIGEALTTDAECQKFAQLLYRYKDFIYLGRDIDYPIALEGALKLKEISYIHAEGYPTGELKHGPTALVHEGLPLVVLAAHDKDDPDSMLRYSKTVSNIREFLEREIPVLAIVNESDKEITALTPCVLPVPDVPVLLQPIVEVVPLQLLAYHIAVLCGRNVDQPRHLSKSVVIE